MKARIKATGEIFKVMEYSHDANGGYVVLSGGQVMKADCVELILESNEQRRYEIAKDCLAGYTSNSSDRIMNANVLGQIKTSIKIADVLIEELKGERNEKAKKYRCYGHLFRSIL